MGETILITWIIILSLWLINILLFFVFWKLIKQRNHRKNIDNYKKGENNGK